MHAVARTTVSPSLTVQEPWACLARYPVSMISWVSPMGIVLDCLIGSVLFSLGLVVLSVVFALPAVACCRAGEGRWPRRSPFARASPGRHGPGRRGGSGSRRPPGARGGRERPAGGISRSRRDRSESICANQRRSEPASASLGRPAPANARRCGRWAGALLANPEALDRRAVTLDVLPLEVIEQAAPAPDQLEQAAAAMVVLDMRLEVVRQLGDAVGEQRHLHLRRPAVVLVQPVVLDDPLLHLCALRQSLNSFPLVCSPRKCSITRRLWPGALSLLPRFSTLPLWDRPPKG